MSSSDSHFQHSRPNKKHGKKQKKKAGSKKSGSARVRPVHQDFHWIDGAARNAPHASFIETTLDVSAGIHTCLQIVYASDLERAANLDADSGQSEAPAIGVFEGDHLLRLSMAASGLLRDEARRWVERLNEEEAVVE